MATLYFYSFDQQWAEEDYKKAVCLLPLNDRMKIAKFIRWQDRQAGISGKLLLRYILFKEGVIGNLEDIQYNRNGKPYLGDDFYFNISHSGKYVVCGIARDAELGVDIEEIRRTNIDEFKSVFTTDEWQSIEDSSYPVAAFYDLWTKKEAVIKADGRGLSIPLSRIDVLGDWVQCEDRNWFIQSVQVDEKYKCHTATSTQQKIDTVEINDFQSLLHLA